MDKKLDILCSVIIISLFIAGIIMFSRWYVMHNHALKDDEYTMYECESDDCGD